MNPWISLTALILSLFASITMAFQLPSKTEIVKATVTTLHRESPQKLLPFLDGINGRWRSLGFIPPPAGDTQTTFWLPNNRSVQVTPTISDKQMGMRTFTTLDLASSLELLSFLESINNHWSSWGFNTPPAGDIGITIWLSDKRSVLIWTWFGLEKVGTDAGYRNLTLQERQAFQMLLPARALERSSQLLEPISAPLLVGGKGNGMDEGAYVSLDFKSQYPYKFWVSSWGEDESYPDGFRYKLLSSYNPATAVVDIVLLLEQKNGEKTEMKHLEANNGTVDSVARVFVDGLSESYQLDFEEQDYSTAKTAEEFERLFLSYGGKSFNPE